MAANLHQHFIDLGCWVLEPDGSAELGLDHGEGGLDVGTLAIVIHELFSVQAEVVIGLGPQGIAVSVIRPGVDLERDDRW